ncbi:MAG: FAD-binding oxidoreductase [Flavobacteriales bacterium]|nr:FAD-binding oxidoreductase [Flavobacteriales bacterium]
MNTSYWERETFLESYDIIVVGGGIAGLSTALELKKNRPDFRVVVLERSWLSDGASSKNAGFACFGSISEFVDDIKDMSFDDVVSLATRRFRGIEKLVKEYSEEVLKLEWNGGHEVFFQEDESSFKECCAFVDRFNDAFERTLNIRPYTVLTVQEFQGITNLVGVISNKYEGGLNTGAMLNAMRNSALSLGVHIFNGVEVKGYASSENEVKVETTNGIWKAKRIAFCTSSFHSELFEDLQMSSKRNQVVVTKPIADLKLNGTFHHHKGFNYFRNIDGRILIGGMRHQFPNTESTSAQGNTDEVVSALTNFLQHKIHTTSEIEIDIAWSGILGVGKDERSVVTQVEENVFVGARLGGIGVAIGSLVGQELAGLIDSSFPK